MKKCYIAALLSLTVLYSVGFGFTDIQPTDELSVATTYLSQKNVIRGYDDGRFQPKKLVNRAEALIIILKATEKDMVTGFSAEFSDVPADAWFANAVNFSVENGIVSGDGATGEFKPGRAVNLAEFGTMLLKAFDIDATKYSLDDVTIPSIKGDEWFAGPLKFLVKYQIISAENLNPSEQLTRGRTTQITFSLLKEGVALDQQFILNLVEEQLIASIKKLESEQILEAAIAVNSAEKFILLAQGQSQKLEAIKKLNEEHKNIIAAAQKTVLALKNVIGAYSAAQNGLVDDIITASKKAWTAADEALQLNASQTKISAEIKKISESMAAQAREVKAQQSSTE